MSHAKRIEVNIDGMKFYVMGNDNEKYIKDLAADLDEKIKETARTNYKLNQVQTLVLCALNVLDDFEKMKMEEIKDLKKQLLIFEEENKKSNKSYRDLQEKNNDLEDRNRRLNRDLMDKNQALTEAKEEIKKLEGSISNLEEKNNSASRRIIDLSRELENIYEEK